MGHIKIQIFKCDRCGAEERFEDSTRQPKGWRGIQSWIPPLSSPIEDTDCGKSIICPKCVDQYVMWFGMAEKTLT